MRLSEEEFAQVKAAAGEARLTPTGYAGEVTIAAARAAAGACGPGSRFELATVQRELFAVRTALVGAATVLDADQCAAAVERLDGLVDRVHALLTRS
ncbi:hypothetical protein ABZ403_21350 [Micromonospora zamorensis]|uniref:hypothetical protein n=1 Tax=Micromonospora zamorensis TaxID=709883 RepID=UPI0033D5963D